jgi:aryl-alcohol dehydrogenase-like predicted oxidoreductase
MKFEKDDIRNADPKFIEPRFSQYMNAVEGIEKFAHEHYGKTVLEFAARWVLDRPGISVALWGARRPEQLDAIQGALGWRIDKDAMDEVDRIVAEYVKDPVGPEYLMPGVRKA